LLSAVLLTSCATTNYSYDGRAFRKAYESISQEDLKRDLYIIASDEMEGRQTGSEGQKKAGRYMIGQYQKMGVNFPAALNSYYQKVPESFMKTKTRGGSLPESENILAYIPGSEKPEELIVISAHYDHVGTRDGQIYNGADDDGSGTVALMEIAEAFQNAKKAGHGPKRSILFLHVTGEEHCGKNYVYVIGSEMLSSELKKINVEANNKTVKLELNYKYDDPADPQRLYYRSDHYNFAKHNVPAAFFFDGIHADYHKPGDDPDKIDYVALQKRTQLVFATAWELANRAERIVVDGKNTR